MQPGDRIIITPDRDAYECPLCGGCHPFESIVHYVNGDMIDATDECGDIDCFPVEWCAPGRLYPESATGASEAAVAEILGDTEG